MRLLRTALMLTAMLVPMVSISAVPEFAITIARTPDLVPTTMLHRINLTTGELTPIGPSPVSAEGLVFSQSGVLFGVDSAEDQILRFDLSTGQAETVALLDIDLVDSIPVGLAFTNDGRLWMMAYIDNAHTLFAVDPVSGHAEEMSEIELRFAGGLASIGDALYALGHDLAIIDRNTGEPFPVGPSQSGGYSSIGMAANGSGNLWSMHVCNLCMTPFDVIRMTVTDPASGQTAFTELMMPHGTRGVAIRPWVRHYAIQKPAELD